MNNIQKKLFIVPGCHITLMQAENADELQALLERCADYSLLVSGFPADPSAAASLLTDCPEGKTLVDKFVFGVSARKQGLYGVLDAIRDYPNPGDWWLGLLLLDPGRRNLGLGRRIYQSFEDWLSQLGARHIYLGVLEENQKAYQFWRTMGFEIIERRPARQFGSVSHVVITMMQNLSEAKND